MLTWTGGISSVQQPAMKSRHNERDKIRRAGTCWAGVLQQQRLLECLRKMAKKGLRLRGTCHCSIGCYLSERWLHAGFSISVDEPSRFRVFQYKRSTREVLHLLRHVTELCRSSARTLSPFPTMSHLRTSSVLMSAVAGHQGPSFLPEGHTELSSRGA